MYAFKVKERKRNVEIMDQSFCSWYWHRYLIELYFNVIFNGGTGTSTLSSSAPLNISRHCGRLGCDRWKGRGQFTSLKCH